MNELNNISDDSTFRLWVVQTLTELKVTMTAQVTSHDDHEKRIRVVEKNVWIACGASSVLTAIAAIIIKKVFGI